MIWHTGSSPRTAKDERPFRIRFSIPMPGWATVPSRACGGWVGNGPPRTVAAFPPEAERIERLAAEIDALLD